MALDSTVSDTAGVAILTILVDRCTGTDHTIITTLRDGRYDRVFVVDDLFDSCYDFGLSDLREALISGPELMKDLPEPPPAPRPCRILANYAHVAPVDRVHAPRCRHASARHDRRRRQRTRWLAELRA